MARKKQGTVIVHVDGKRVAIDPLQPLPPLRSTKQTTAAPKPTGAQMLKQRGVRRQVLSDPIPPGRYPGLDASRARSS